MDEKMGNKDGADFGNGSQDSRRNLYVYVAVALIAAAIYLGCIISPPSLMDDVDAVQAQIARNMLTSGDWVTARIDGVAYLEKAPLIYWLIAICYKIFGVHDWAARIPVALASIGLAWLTAAMGVWAFGRRAGFYAGLCVATCIGLFLFTRIQIPDVMETASIALSLWAFLRVMDEREEKPRVWAAAMAASLGVGLLLKSLIGIVFPAAAAAIYLLFMRQFFLRETWKRLRPWSGIAIILAIAAPWHVLATLRNPPHFDFTMHSEPGQYHGFFWFFFINEQLLRFLNRRYPRDYDTVPRVWFWLFHLLWLFPWSVYLPATLKLSYRPEVGSGDVRAGRMRLLALCWIGFVLIFFTFSTTQEYYSMPCYPALALLLGCAMAAGGSWVKWGTRALALVAACAALAVFTLWFLVRNTPAPGDIASALSHNPGAYTLSLGHMEDLTIQSFAYLRAPLLLAGVAFTIGVAGVMLWSGRKAFLAAAVMMVLFFHAARMALVTFDPYLSSRPLAEALLRSPAGTLVIDHHYYTFSSVFFYTDRKAWLLNGRFNNLVYGSYAPDAPDVFLNDEQWKRMWLGPERTYIVADQAQVPRFTALVGEAALHVVLRSGGKVLLANRM
jgi:4-amino-4-deoxy-L-arabinose transferase-like glycosyltransferase